MPTTDQSGGTLPGPEKKPTMMHNAGVGAKRNAEGLGTAGAVVVAWALTSFAGVTLPPEVTIALGTLIGAIAARIKG